MSLQDGLSPGDVVWLLTVALMAVSVAVAGLAAIGAAEARSRRGERERVAAIRRRLAEEQRQARREVGVQS